MDLSLESSLSGPAQAAHVSKPQLEWMCLTWYISDTLWISQQLLCHVTSVIRLVPVGFLFDFDCDSSDIQHFSDWFKPVPLGNLWTIKEDFCKSHRFCESFYPGHAIYDMFQDWFVFDSLKITDPSQGVWLTGDLTNHDAESAFFVWQANQRGE